MKRLHWLLLFSFHIYTAQAQGPAQAAQNFVRLLDTAAQHLALFPFASEERYEFHFYPKADRKGITWSSLTPAQQIAAMALLKTCLSAEAVAKARAIMQLETVLKALENRPAADHFRDTGNYHFSIFGNPAPASHWGWRLEGHHVSFLFFADSNKLVSGTPGFLGANPAIVLQGQKQGLQVLKEEADAGFALLHALSPAQLQKALIDTAAPGEIVTFVHRSARIDTPQGILYTELNPQQQQQLVQLVAVYVHRYTRLFADDLFAEIAAAGLQNLRFAWAGAQHPEIGKPHYYRVQGPTFVIEYDNSQNNANHAHAVFRDLNSDFGDLLQQHYASEHR